jgi:hypothetical protein
MKPDFNCYWILIAMVSLCYASPGVSMTDANLSTSPSTAALSSSPSLTVTQTLDELQNELSILNSELEKVILAVNGVKTNDNLDSLKSHWAEVDQKTDLFSGTFSEFEKRLKDNKGKYDQEFLSLAEPISPLVKEIVKEINQFTDKLKKEPLGDSASGVNSTLNDDNVQLELKKKLEEVRKNLNRLEEKLDQQKDEQDKEETRKELKIIIQYGSYGLLLVSVLLIVVLLIVVLLIKKRGIKMAETDHELITRCYINEINEAVKMNEDKMQKAMYEGWQIERVNIGTFLENKFEEFEQKLDEKRKELDENRKELDENRKELDENRKELINLTRVINELKTDIGTLKGMQSEKLLSKGGNTDDSSTLPQNDDLMLAKFDEILTKISQIEQSSRQPIQPDLSGQFSQTQSPDIISILQKIQENLENKDILKPELTELNQLLQPIITSLSEIKEKQEEQEKTIVKQDGVSQALNQKSDHLQSQVSDLTDAINNLSKNVSSNKSDHDKLILDLQTKKTANETLTQELNEAKKNLTKVTEDKRKLEEENKKLLDQIKSSKLRVETATTSDQNYNSAESIIQPKSINPKVDKLVEEYNQNDLQVLFDKYKDKFQYVKETRDLGTDEYPKLIKTNVSEEAEYFILELDKEYYLFPKKRTIDAIDFQVFLGAAFESSKKSTSYPATILLIKPAKVELIKSLDIPTEETWTILSRSSKGRFEKK